MEVLPKNFNKQFISWNPELIRLSDFVHKSNVINTLNLARETFGTFIGIFEFHDNAIRIIEEIYEEPIPEYPKSESLKLLNVIFEKKREDILPLNSKNTLIGHPIWLHYDAKTCWKSIIKGCLILVSPSDDNAVNKNKTIAKILADLMSERISVAYSSRLHKTNYERLENELKSGNNQLANIINNIGAGLLLIDKDYKIVWSNSVTKEIFGNSIDGKLCYKALYGKDTVCENCIIQRTINNGMTTTDISTVDIPGVGIRHFKTVTTPIFDDDGKIIQVLKLNYDVTDAKAAQYELQTYKRLVDNSEEFISITDEDGILLLANRKALNELGYGEKEIIGESAYSFILDEDQEKIRAASQHAIETGFAFETARLKRKDGSIITVETVITYDPDRRILAAIGHDITERIKLEKAIQRNAVKLREQNKQVLAAIEEKNRFFRSISHELRTPLCSIVGFTELLLEDTDNPLTDAQKKHLEKVRYNADKLLEMVNDMLDLSKIEAKQIKLNIAKVELKEFLSNIIESIMPLALEKGLNIETCFPDSMPLISTDPQKLGQIIENLLSNAIKFTQEGKVKLSVHINEKSISIQISDTGIGIPESDLPHLFKEFYRGTASYSKIRGTGLGLAISQRLASLLGGNITVESQTGIGSTFTLHLPLDPSKYIEYNEDNLENKQLELAV